MTGSAVGRPTQQHTPHAATSNTSRGILVPEAQSQQQSLEAAADMFPKTTRRSRDRPRRWKLLTPTVLWSVVILAMAPSFYGFAGELGGSLNSGRSSIGRSVGAGVAAADLASATSSGIKGQRDAKGSPFAAASWLKERVRDGTRKVQMQVGAWVPGCLGGSFVFGCHDALEMHCTFAI